MTQEVKGTGVSSNVIAKSLALFFSYMLPQGYFANTWIEFNNDARMHTWKGSTPVEKYMNDRTSAVGGTNFQSVIDLFVKIKHSGTEESDFPTGILCISDYEFDPSSLNKTNVETALNKLLHAGFSHEYVSNFQIILWNIPNEFYGGRDKSVKFETYGDVPNVYYLSGLDPSIISFLTGVEKQVSVPKNAEELFSAAMDQEIMKLLEV